MVIPGQKIRHLAEGVAKSFLQGIFIVRNAARTENLSIKYDNRQWFFRAHSGLPRKK
jgi:hypothetical protein